MLDVVALFAAWFTGLIGSGHCIAMCGALSQGLAQHCGGGCAGSLRRHCSRILGYALLGALAGGLGNTGLAITRSLSWHNDAQSISGILAIVIGVAVLLGNNRIAWLSRLGIKLLPLLQRLRARLPKTQGIRRDLGAGLIWAMMPCGMVYALVLSAWLSTSAVQGGLLLLSFGLGTLPTMLSLEIFAARLQRTRRLQQVAALSLVLLGSSAVAIAQGWLRLPMPTWLPEACLPPGLFVEG